MSCINKLKELYRDKLTPETIADLAKLIDSELAKGTPRESYMRRIRELMGDVHSEKLAEVLNFAMNRKAVLDVIEFVKQPQYKGDINGAIHDIMFEGVDVTKNSGLSIEYQRKYYRASLVDSFDMAIYKIDETAHAKLADFSLKESIALRRAMSGTPSKNPFIDYLADLFVHQNKTLYSSKYNAGLPTRYNPDYGFHRVYDAQKVQDLGFKNVSRLLLSNLDYERSRFNGLTKESIAAIKPLLEDPRITDEILLDQMASFRKSSANAQYYELLSELKEFYENFKKEFDPNENLNKTKLEVKEEMKARKFRALVFRNADAEMTVMNEIGKYDHNIYQYIKADSESIARDLAFVSRLGPTPYTAFDQIIGELKSLAIKDKNYRFAAGDAESKFAVLRGDIVPAVRKLTDVQDTKTAYNFLTTRLVDITNSAVLATSVISQLRDMQPIATQYFYRSNEPLMRKVSTLFSNSLGAVKQSWNNEKELAIFIPNLIERTFGEFEAKDAMLNPFVKATGKMLSYTGADYLNRFSSTVSLRLAAHTLQNLRKGTKEFQMAEEVLGRHGLGVADIPYFSTMATSIDSPMQIRNLPTYMFENNPDGIAPEAYREKLSKGVYTFMLSYLRNGVPSSQMRELIFLGGNPDKRSVLSSTMNMMSQLRRIVLSTVNQHRAINNATNRFQHRGANAAMLFGTSAAIGSFLYMTTDYFRTFIREDADVAKTDEKYFNGKNVQQKAFEAFMRSNALALFTEPMYQFYDAKSKQQGVQGFVPPSVSLVMNATTFGVDMVNNVLGETPEVISKEGARSFVNAARLTIPAYNLLYYVPLLDAKTQIEGTIIEVMDELDGTATKKRGSGGGSFSL